MEVKLSKKQKITVQSSEDIYLIMRQILRRENKVGQSQEHFWMIGLNQMNKIIYIELAALGSSNRLHITPRDAFRLAVHKLAIQVILVHNHPSSQVEPSSEDLDFTDHFIQAGKFLNIEVVDHLIICEESYYSFVDSGVFEELKKSKKWVLPYELEEKAKKEGLEEGEKKKAYEMAKNAITEGLSIDLITRLTGLSAAEIEQL